MSEFVKCEYLPIGYLINKEGEVKKQSNNKILKPQMSNSGYLFYNLKENKKQKGRFLHRALAFAFIDKESNKDTINHKDGNKLNNSLDNLEWCTRGENNKHAYDTGLKKYRPLHYKGKSGFLHNRSKSVICVESGVIYGSQSEAGRLLKISHTSVHWSIKNKKPIFGMHFQIKE
jgi:hypothetical protein